MTLAYSGLELITPLPTNVKASSRDGLHRGSVFKSDGSWEADGIWLDWKATSNVTLDALHYGVKVTVPTTPGKTYVLSGRINVDYANVTEHENAAWKFALLKDDLYTSTVEFTPEFAHTAKSFPTWEFVATAESTEVGVIIPQELTGTAGSTLCRAVLYDMKLSEKDFSYPQRLRNTVYASTLSNHLDLACNSVGASWIIDKAGTTRIIDPAKFLPVSHVFSDEAGSEFLEYIDLEPQHATASVVNLVEVTNLGIGADGNEGNGVHTYEDQDSIQKYGLHKESLTVNVGTRKAVYDDEGELEQYVPDDGLDSLMTELMSSRVNPTLTIKKIVWNAQQNLDAAMRLELGQRVAVRFRGQEYDAQIAYLQHDITPTRWLITITLRLP